jgi:hypothetical protein
LYQWILADALPTGPGYHLCTADALGTLNFFSLHSPSAESSSSSVHQKPTSQHVKLERVDDVPLPVVDGMALYVSPAVENGEACCGQLAVSTTKGTISVMRRTEGGSFHQDRLVKAHDHEAWVVHHFAGDDAVIYSGTPTTDYRLECV